MAHIGDLVTANHILAQQGIVDAFGHVSVRSASHPTSMYISRSLAPELVSASDIVEVDIQTCEAVGSAQRSYLERFIHCGIYRADPAAQSVVHVHSPSLIPFGATGTRLKPVYHMSGFLTEGAPIFDIRSAAGPATDMLIRDNRLGDALAKVRGSSAVVLMRGHGGTIVGSSIQQAVFRSIYTERNAELQAAAMRLGSVTYLTAEEGRHAAATNDEQIGRAWSLWAAHAASRVAGGR